MNWKPSLSKVILIITLAAVFTLPLGGAALDPAARGAKIRAFSRPLEFDYISWTVSALGAKLRANALGAARYLDREEGSQLVREYLDLWKEIVQLEREYQELITDPDNEGEAGKAPQLRQQLEEKRKRRQELRPVVESFVQRQLSTALSDLGLSPFGQPLPPVRYHAEPDAYALIVSPRDEIRQEANLMLISDLSLEERIALEERIEQELDLSALVVGVGGVGLYPAMIIETGDLNWTYHVLGHEWTHNFLTLRPLGMHYFSSPALQTINETVADLSAQAIQRRVLELYYPELVPAQAPENAEGESDLEMEEPPSIRELQEQVEGSGDFDFRFEMHITRVVVDRLLSEGRIQEAEAYMEQRRAFFWENGYPIRRLNQAYFAFYGSYAALPGGAAGEEGVDLGSQLRALRESSPSFSSFMRKVAWMWRLEQFQREFQAMDIG